MQVVTLNFSTQSNFAPVFTFLCKNSNVDRAMKQILELCDARRTIVGKKNTLSGEDLYMASVLEVLALET